MTPISSEKHEVTDCRWCGAAVLALCFAHILTIGAMAYQVGWLSGPEFVLVNYGVWISPLLIVLLSRNRPLLLFLCAIPILVMFAGHMYYFWQHYMHDINVIRTSEWVWYLTTLTGGLTVGLVAVFLLFLIIKAVVYLIVRPFSGPEAGGK